MCKWNKQGENRLTVEVYGWVKTAGIFCKDCSSGTSPRCTKKTHISQHSHIHSVIFNKETASFYSEPELFYLLSINVWIHTDTGTCNTHCNTHTHSLSPTPVPPPLSHELSLLCLALQELGNKNITALPRSTCSITLTFHISHSASAHGETPCIYSL